MIESEKPSPYASARLRDWWRGLWGRGDSRLSAHLDAELTHTLMLDIDSGPSEEPGCGICRLRVRLCQDWISDLPLGPARSAMTSLAPTLSYCPRHLRLLLAVPDGQQHVHELLPELLAAAHEIAHSPHADLVAAATPSGCSVCAGEDRIQTDAVDAAAQLPHSRTGTLPGLADLDVCHQHALLIAARIVGRLGPEPRAIPELHTLLSHHRHQLRHLIARDRPRVEQLGRALVVVCDADAALPSPRADRANGHSPAPRHCAVCAAAASETRALLVEMSEQLRHTGHQPHPKPNIGLCQSHLRDLLNQSRREDDTDDPTLVASIARTQLAQLAPALNWLDSGFGHPHTIRRSVVELAAPRPCPACDAYLEGQRHTLATLATTGELATQADRPDSAICLRHSTSLGADHPARIALTEALRTAHALLQELPTHQVLTVAAAGGITIAAPASSTDRDDAAPHPVLIHALGLLDGRIHHDTAGAADAPIP